MNEQELTELYQQICKWLGEKYEDFKIWLAMENLKIDFLNDRNQQKWIIDKLRKSGYRIEILITEIDVSVRIFDVDTLLEYEGVDESEGIALLMAMKKLKKMVI